MVWKVRQSTAGFDHPTDVLKRWPSVATQPTPQLVRVLSPVHWNHLLYQTLNIKLKLISAVTIGTYRSPSNVTASPVTASHFRVIDDCDSTRRVSEGSGQAATASPRIEDDPDFNGRIALHCVMRHVHSEVAVIVKIIILMNRSTSNCYWSCGNCCSSIRRASCA